MVPQLDQAWRARQETERLVWALRETGLFPRVDYEENFRDEEVLLVSSEPITPQCFSEPLLTLLTLGIIPNETCYRSGFRLVISRHTRAVHVDSVAEGRLMIGWIAPLVSAFPGWSASYPREAEATGLRLALGNALAQFSEADAQ